DWESVQSPASAYTGGTGGTSRARPVRRAGREVSSESSGPSFEPWRPLMRSLSLAAAAVLFAMPAAAQVEGMPPGWRAITDTPGEYVAAGIEPNAGARYNFVAMAPGW